MGPLTASRTGVRHICPYIALNPDQLAQIGGVLPGMCAAGGSQAAVVSTATPINTNTSDVRAIADTICITLGLSGLPALACCVTCRFKKPTAPSNVVAPNNFR